jgi:hypothetical protein
MYVYMYVYMYVCCTCTQQLKVCTYVCMYLYTTIDEKGRHPHIIDSCNRCLSDIEIIVSIHTCLVPEYLLYECMCMYVCMYVYVYVYVYVCNRCLADIEIIVSMHTCLVPEYLLYEYMCMYVCMCMCMCVIAVCRTLRL